MDLHDQSFNEKEVLHLLKHYLPNQAPLKDFIHHNTLHAFQDLKFHTALARASEIFGYRVTLSLNEYRQLYKKGKIREDVLDRLLSEKKPGEEAIWKEKLLDAQMDHVKNTRIGKLRKAWKQRFNFDLDHVVQPVLFRIICSYLDQGVSIWNYPPNHLSLLRSVKELQKNAFAKIFTSPRVIDILESGHASMENLLDILVGDPRLYTQYLFDQQFAHQGWSGMAAFLEDHPESLLDRRKINLHDFIVLELLLEIDALDRKFKQDWKPLASRLLHHPEPLFGDVEIWEFWQILYLWQDAFEWSYYDGVLAGIQSQAKFEVESGDRTFQALFCIDDRECSFRRYLEKFDPLCQTFGTAGFFNAEFYYQPEHGKFFTKLCPAPLNPKFLIKEVERKSRRRRDVHFTKRSHNLLTGWLITQTLGFWSAFRLFLNVFKPSMSPATTSSFRHMDKFAKLTYQNYNPHYVHGDLQIGFSVDEMTDRVEGLLKSIGLVKDFAKIVYVVGHGASSANNTHYAGYDCGACSGRPGSVNARVICHMANHPKVRAKLEERGLMIPADTHFFGALHDTTRDEIEFFDEASLPWLSIDEHLRNQFIFKKALAHNARERSRRFESIDPKWSLSKINRKVKVRSVSLFEPRPEYNHATNCLCIVGRRQLTKQLFLDRRSFLNSYDYRIDPDGKYLTGILKAVAPVCGGINLEYYFSRVDNHKLGAGTKLPHNVMGLIGVANGIDGDLRPGLPAQMVEIHDPLRLLVVVEHYPDVILNVLKNNPATYEWFLNEWIHLTLIHPVSNEVMVFKDGEFNVYQTMGTKLNVSDNLTELVQSSRDNIPVHILQ
ncbi:MAG TPA: DUF2309 domain-containing protein [Bacteroidia bacterium]|nr:DUF2309 domain-containing protein [Bacteroidia bacterium]